MHKNVIVAIAIVAVVAIIVIALLMNKSPLATLRPPRERRYTCTP